MEKPPAAMAEVSSEDSTRGASPSQLTHKVVGTPQILMDFWTEDLNSFLDAGQTLASSSAPCHIDLSIENRVAVLAVALLAAGFP